ncbi:MAG: chemotaxis protein CheW [Singulisphaera sp.]
MLGRCRWRRWPRPSACPSAAGRGRWRRPNLVVAAGERKMAFLVDGLLAEQEIIVKGLGARSPRPPRLGATILPTGRVALVLNAAHMAAALGRARPSRGAGDEPGRSPQGQGPARRRRLRDHAHPGEESAGSRRLRGGDRRRRRGRGNCSRSRKSNC